MKNKLYRIGAIALTLSLALGFSALGDWQKDANGWWYQNSNGGYPQDGIYKIGGKFYAFDEYGYMKENEWFEDPDSGKWYYASGSGELTHSQWVGDYYVGNDGSMMTDAWIDGYYVGSDGKWEKGATKIDNTYNSSYDDYDTSNNPIPFRDVPLGSVSYNNNYSGSLGRSELETADIHHYNW